MMVATRRKDRLIDRLPKLRGRLEERAPLAGLTWFRVGGPAELLFTPADRDDLSAFLAGRPADVPLVVLGLGSNLLVRDGGVDGVVVRLGRAFAAIDIEDEEIRAGAGAIDRNVALACRDAGLAGLEFLSGVPGTIGGAVRMNAGAYGAEIKDVLLRAEALDGGGEAHLIGLQECGFTYRHCAVPEDWIFTSATLRGEIGERAEIGRRIDEIAAQRTESQPRNRTGGSTFTNPDGAKAWELIERAGCRGLVRGGAKVSAQHCNFLVNTGAASAADIEGLGEEVRRRVFEATGVRLEWEIRRIGNAREDTT